MIGTHQNVAMQATAKCKSIKPLSQTGLSKKCCLVEAHFLTAEFLMIFIVIFVYSYPSIAEVVYQNLRWLLKVLADVNSLLATQNSARGI